MKIKFFEVFLIWFIEVFFVEYLINDCLIIYFFDNGFKNFIVGM